MNDKPYRVHVVVNPHYGESIPGLPVEEPAWVVDSQDNHPVIQALWDERKRTDHLTGITSFKFDGEASPEDWLVSILASIDLHHGKFSHDPPYSILNVIGVKCSDRIQKELNEFGFNQYKPTPEGFIATREG